jgi:hypothetical protein
MNGLVSQKILKAQFVGGDCHMVHLPNKSKKADPVVQPPGRVNIYD